ncbi:MAG TPA: zinc-dependent metalloprotease, partial [Pyrinomonadaceae bacterium]
LIAPYGQDKSVVAEILEQVVLARLRQLSAHEVGHTLGLQHNFAASINNRASVMDYPAPYVKLVTQDSRLNPDISEAYAKGIGEWDKVAIAYGYQDFPAATDEKAALDKILSDAFKRGLMYLTDQDARPAGASTSVAHLWDNGANVIDGLENLVRVRDVALNRLGENNIREGAPLATLEDVLVPLYMGHRYQVEAVAKLIGGEDYSFSLRGKGDRNPQIIPPDEQKRALYAVLETLKPHNLRLPESLLRLIPPRPPGYPRNREHFRIRTSPAFDALAPAEAYANHVTEFLFNPERAARIVEFHARSGVEYPTLDDVFDKILAETFRSGVQGGYEGEIQRTVNAVVLNKLMVLAANERASNTVRAIAELKLDELKNWAAQNAGATRYREQRAFLLYTANQIKRFQDDPKKMNLTRPSDPPDGQPIGTDWWGMSEREWCDWP